MKALYAGSFDPFTTGHLDIVRRSLEIFPQLIIGVGVNEHKSEKSSVDQRVDSIRKIFEKESRVEVKGYEGLTAEFAKEAGACVLIRGVRNGTEFDKEKELADINLKVLGMPTVILPADPSLTFVSSTMVRELSHNGWDISPFLPITNVTKAE